MEELIFDPRLHTKTVVKDNVTEIHVFDGITAYNHPKDLYLLFVQCIVDYANYVIGELKKYDVAVHRCEHFFALYCDCA